MTVLADRVQLAHKGDVRGRLAIAQLGDTLPFVVRRVYWIHGTQPEISRGYHAHKRLRQVFVCVVGSVNIYLHDGTKEEVVAMEAFGPPLSVGPGLWRVMSDFSPDCVLMVLADRVYEEDDYIRDFETFQRHSSHA
jgi:dTDP-4-dehydrorhamnose 3,5-epimerase-like enzyme